MGDRPRGPTAEQWAEVRKAYEAGESMVSLSKRTGVARTTLIRRRDQQGWTLQPATQVSNIEAKAVRERTTAQVIDMASRRVIERLEQSGGIDAQVHAIDDLLQGQVKLYAKAAKLLDSTLDRAISGLLKLGVTQGETTALADILASLTKYSRDVRTAGGLREGQPTMASEDSDDKRIDQPVLIVRERSSETA